MATPELPPESSEPARRIFAGRSDPEAAAPDPLAAQLRAGDTVGDFQLVELLGRGGMGAVWEAEERALQRRVALKLILPKRMDDKVIALFHREARAGGRLSHPGLVAVHSYGEVNGIHYISQELVGSGHNLTGVLHSLRELGAAPVGFYREAAEFLVAVAEAMQAAHDAGVIHRDLKPQNILVDHEGKPKITDFGLARIVGEPSLSGHLGVLGTYYYMSPEQAMAKSLGIDHRTDIFSLGVVLYELLTLKRPFEGDTEQQIQKQILWDDPPPPRLVRSRVPRDLSVICMKCLEKNRDHRYASMAELVDDLRRHLRNEPIQARPPGALRRAQKWALRHPTRSVALGVGASALVVISALLVRTLRAEGDAHRQAIDAENRAREVLRLADVKTLRDLCARAEELWPVHPDRVSALDTWLSDAQSLIDHLGAHRDSLEQVRSRGTSHRDAADPAAVQFAAPQDAWWYETLHELVAELTRFADVEAEGNVVASVRRRRDRSRTIVKRSIDDHRDAWDDAIFALSESERYHHLALEPQVGLVPLGEDPRSGLQEFWLVESGDPPRRDPATDGWIVTGETGLVLVLLPGATFTMGATRDPAGPNHDPEARDDEDLQEIALTPFFLSKYEMTQGQWLRTMGWNESYFGPGHGWMREDWAVHPVEQVDWSDCQQALQRLGLALPTEAQWEYGARGGTDTPWWTGRDPGALAAAANLADQSYDRGFTTPTVTLDWNDGYAAHAPVGRFAPNSFGLHDTMGNVWEWCQDVFVTHPLAPRDGSGLRGEAPGDSSALRVYRGGCFAVTAIDARSAGRLRNTPVYQSGLLGVRPARQLER